MISPVHLDHDAVEDAGRGSLDIRKRRGRLWPPEEQRYRRYSASNQR
jgi:hypothetical protein